MRGDLYVRALERLSDVALRESVTADRSAGRRAAGTFHVTRAAWRAVLKTFTTEHGGARDLYLTLAAEVEECANICPTLAGRTHLRIARSALIQAAEHARQHEASAAGAGAPHGSLPQHTGAGTGHPWEPDAEPGAAKSATLTATADGPARREGSASLRSNLREVEP